MFWTVVHQGYSAKFNDPNKAGDAHILRHHWEVIRPSVAEFDAILMEFWPDPAKHLDTLHPHDRKKILNQLKILYQGRTEQSIYHMKAWKLLAHYSKWRHVFRPLILRQQAGKTTVPRKARNETVNYEEKKAATTTSISHERPVSASSTERVTGAKRRQEGEDHVSYPEYMGVKVKGDVAVVAPIIRLDQTKQPLGKKKARNATQTLEWIRTIESKGYSASPTRNVPAVTPQKLEKTQLLNVKSSQNSDGDATERVSGVHLALAWANISCSCVDMSPRLEESHDWFWFLVSSIYFDLADCRSDIEQILRKSLRERANTYEYYQPRGSRVDGFTSPGGLLDAKWPLVPASRGLGGLGVPQRLRNYSKAIVTWNGT